MDISFPLTKISNIKGQVTGIINSNHSIYNPSDEPLPSEEERFAKLTAILNSLRPDSKYSKSDVKITKPIDFVSEKLIDNKSLRCDIRLGFEANVSWAPTLKVSIPVLVAHERVLVTAYGEIKEICGPIFKIAETIYETGQQA